MTRQLCSRFEMVAEVIPKVPQPQQPDRLSDGPLPTLPRTIGVDNSPHSQSAVAVAVHQYQRLRNRLLPARAIAHMVPPFLQLVVAPAGGYG